MTTSTERRVDFYQLATDGPQARERYACRLAEKALRNGYRTLLLARDDGHVAELDALLWSFAPESFLPHGRDTADPVCVASAIPDSKHTLLVNLAGDLAEAPGHLTRIAEIVPADPAAREGARAAYRRWQQRGYTVHYHDLGQPRRP